MVPLALEGDDAAVFINRLCNSSQSCRPLRFAFERESKIQTGVETDRLEGEIKACEDSLIYRSEKFPNLEVVFVGHFTMLDQKVVGELTQQANSNCPMCGATPTVIRKNDPSLFKVINEDFLDYGMSPLHYWMRCFEMVANLGFRRNVSYRTFL